MSAVTQGKRLCSAARLSSGGKLPAHQDGPERSAVVRSPAGPWQSAMIKRPRPFIVATTRPSTSECAKSSIGLCPPGKKAAS
jgi:hypothetical protein